MNSGVEIVPSSSHGESKIYVGPAETVYNKPGGIVKSSRSKLKHSIFYLRNLKLTVISVTSLWYVSSVLIGQIIIIIFKSNFNQLPHVL